MTPVMETYLLLCTFLFSALVDTSVSLSCIQCQAESDQSCKGQSQMCPPESDVCTSTLEVNTTGTMDKKLFRRYCGTKELCSLSGSYSVHGGKIKLGSSCCYTSNCLPPAPILPSDKPEKNGLSCKACYSANGPCTTFADLECTGDENKCAAVTVSGQTQLFMSGCSTPGLCSRSYEEPYQDGEIQSLILCSNGNLVQQSLFLALISLLYTFTW